MMIVYLAMIAPDHEGPTVLGVFSTLELAQRQFAEASRWDFNPQYQQYWRTNVSGLGYTDDEIHPLTMDELTR